MSNGELRRDVYVEGGEFELKSLSGGIFSPLELVVDAVGIVS